jgi:hypothetical protein
VIVFAMLLPSPVLWLLGPQYSHLKSELLLMVVSLAATGFSGLFWSVLQARGWVASSAWVIFFGIVAQVLGASMLDLTTVSGVLSLGLCATLPSLLVASVLLWREMRRWAVSP